MQKTYLSRAVTRAMSLDHPIGDPFGGTAYGEKNDPISAIISISTMAGTYAAAGSFAAMTLMQGLAFAGGALSLAGNVTGNKSLMKIGMVAGIAGGIGMLAESVMGTTIGGTLGETFGFGEAAGSGLSQTVPSTTGGGQTPVVDGVQTAAESGYNVYSQPLGSVPTTTDVALANAAVNTPGGAAASLNAPGAPLTVSPGGTEISLFGGDGGASVGLSPTGSGFQAGPSGADALYKVGEATKPGMAGQFLEFANKNPMVTLMGFQAVSGLSDFLSGKTDAEIAAYEAQVGFADARALEIQEEIAKEKQRRINLNAGYNQVNTAMPIDTGVSIPAPGAPGLIAGNMPPRG